MCYLKPKLTFAACALKIGGNCTVYLVGKYIVPFSLGNYLTPIPSMIEGTVPPTTFLGTQGKGWEEWLLGIFHLPLTQLSGFSL